MVLSAAESSVNTKITTLKLLNFQGKITFNHSKKKLNLSTEWLDYWKKKRDTWTFYGMTLSKFQQDFDTIRYWK